ERIRVGIVGASPQSWAAATHLPALAHLDEFTVTAVATTRQDSARATADTFGIRHAFASADELASHPEGDLVVVSVKVPAHAVAVRAALAAGKHVYTEWPLAVDLAEASALADAAAAAGVVHAVNLQAYHAPGARFVADLLADGRIGPVESVSMTAAGDPLGGSRIPRALAWGTEPPAGNNPLTVMPRHALAAPERVAGPLADVSAVLANHHDRVVVAETGELIPNHVPGQLALHGRLGNGALLSLAIHGGSAPTPSGFAITIAGADGALTITPADPAQYPGWAEWRGRRRGGARAPPRPPRPPRPPPLPPAAPGALRAHRGGGAARAARAHRRGVPRDPPGDHRGPPGAPRLRPRRASPPDARGHRAGRPDRRPPAAPPAGRTSPEGRRAGRSPPESRRAGQSPPEGRRAGQSPPADRRRGPATP